MLRMSFESRRHLRVGVALALVATLWSATAGAQGFQFGPRTPLNTNAATDTSLDFFEKVATDGTGTWVAVWMSQPLIPFTGGYGEADILVARSTDDGVTWSAPVPIYPNPGLDTGFDSAPALAGDGAGNWVVAWRSFPYVGGIPTDDDLLVAHSSDGGATWSVPVPLNADAATDHRSEGGARIATDRAGTWVAIWAGRVSGSDDIYTARSTDLGVTWSSPAVLDTSVLGPMRSDGDPALVTDGTTWVTVWQASLIVGGESSDVDLFVARSLDGGVTWSAPAPLNTNAAIDVEYDRMPDLATDGTGAWVAVWTVQSFVDPEFPSDADVLVARSTDDGVTWSAPAPLNTNAAVDEGSDEGPVVATDGATWVAAWMSGDSLGGTLPINYRNILQARSSDGGVTWTAPLPLNTDAYFNDCSYREYLDPQLATDGAGVWLAVWWGLARGCPGLPGNDYDIFMARATTACGNGVLDAGEQCDDGGLVAGDGCDPSCHVEPPPSICGNGIQEIGERCDDGNPDFDDGCDPSCHFDPPPSVCGNGVVELGEQCDDGNVIAHDGCDPTCQREFPDFPPISCGNGALDSGEACDDGGRVPGDGCDDLCRLEPCRATPDPTCRGALSRKASLKIKHLPDARKNRIEWKWRGTDAVAKADFGDPLVTDDYSVCVYDAGHLVSSTHIRPGEMCGSKPCWKVPASGYAFQDKALAQGGASRLVLTAGAAGKAQLRFAGRGASLWTPSLPVAGAVEVQLRVANRALCWGATFHAPFRQNVSGGFSGRSD